MPTSTFHPGERAVQLRAGEDGIANRNAALIEASILGRARPFIHRQFMVVLASSDAGGAWSSLVYGEPGFARAAGDAQIALDVPTAQRDPTDPFWANIEARPAVGMLFIDLDTRRRYRINGSVTRNDESGLEIAVQQAYPNCPKYIQRRRLRHMDTGPVPHGGAAGVAGVAGVTRGAAITGGVETLVRAADTLFVATVHPVAGADASHRGGPPGFVQVAGPRTLRLPDYQGNSMFNTFGNLELDPHIGLCIPDFAGGRLLQLSGRGRLLWDQDDPAKLSGGTGRFLEVEVDRWILRQVPQHLEWEFVEASPFNPPAAPPARADSQ